MNIVYHAHSGLRYLVLLVGILAVAYLLYAVATRAVAPKPGRALTAAFTGLLDLQVLLGIVLVVAGVWYPALMGHLVLMLLAAVVAHGASVMSRRYTDVRQANRMRLMGVVLALVLIAAGVAAIGRSLFGSAPPSMPL